jgi:hypothetical protein
MTSDEPVMIWSHEHNAYWRPNGCGYTVRVGGIGIYDRSEAERIVASINADPAKRCEIEEVPAALRAHAKENDQ